MNAVPVEPPRPIPTGGPIRGEEVMMTPEYAAYLINERNEKNRTLNMNSARRFMSDIQRGLWRSNGQTVVVDEDGDLLDGQTRLMGIVLAETTVPIFLVEGVPAERFVTMDCGRSRKLSDVLTIRKVPNARLVAAEARLCYLFATGQSLLDVPPSTPVMDRFVANFPYLQDVARMAGPAGRHIPPAGLAAAVALGSWKDVGHHRVEAFLDGLAHGTGMERGDPRYTAREWFRAVRNRSAFQKNIPGGLTFYVIATAWNAYAHGRQLSAIRAVKERPSIDNLKIVGFDALEFCERFKLPPPRPSMASKPIPRSSPDQPHTEGPAL